MYVTLAVAASAHNEQCSRRKQLSSRLSTTLASYSIITQQALYLEGQMKAKLHSDTIALRPCLGGLWRSGLATHHLLFGTGPWF